MLDSGSRNDFSTVMLKTMRAGVAPNQICRLIYHHYDPDLCANIPHMEALIHSKDLKSSPITKTTSLSTTIPPPPQGVHRRSGV